MNGKKRIALLLFLLVAPLGGVFAQVVVDSRTADFLRGFDQQKVKPARIDTSYWAFNKEISVSAALHSVSKNWYQSDNRSSIRIDVRSILRANYIREYTRWNNLLDLNVGFLWEDAGKLPDGARNLSVSQNRLYLETQYGVKIVRRFDFATNASLETQVLPSYEKNTSDLPNKIFMAPGTLNIGVGMSYSYSNDRIPSLTAAFFPVNTNITLVLDQRLADAGTSGVKPAVKDENGNIIRHGEMAKVVWGFRAENYIKYFILKNKKLWLENKFALFMDYVEVVGALQMTDRMELKYSITDKISVGYVLNLRYFDNETVNKFNPVTGKDEKRPAGMQMINDMGFSLGFKF